MRTVTVFSDIHCPWAGVAVHRLRAARAAHRLDVVFDPRPWPLELVNGHGTPHDIVITEIAVLAQHEPDLFGRWRGPSWPSSFLPAFELVAAARRVHGIRAAEEVDYALRVAFLRDSVDVSVRVGLEQALALAADELPDLDRAAVLQAWDSGTPRADVLADYAHSATLPIQGSPQVFWPDGSTTHNPGLDEHDWVRGIPRIRDSDPGAAARLLRERAG